MMRPTTAPDLKDVESVSEVQISSPVITVWYLKNGLAWVYVANGVFHTSAYTTSAEADPTITKLLKEYREYKADV